MNDKVKLIKIVTVSAVLFLVLLICALIINLIKIPSVNTREKELQAEIDRLNQIIEQNDDELEYKSTQEYVDRFARERLDKMGKDEKVFIGND